MTEKIKVGDVVALKSGGPSMTVVEIADYHFDGHCAKCQWFHNNKLEEALFKIDAIEKDED